MTERRHDLYAAYYRDLHAPPPELPPAVKRVLEDRPLFDWLPNETPAYFITVISTLTVLFALLY